MKCTLSKLTCLAILSSINLSPAAEEPAGGAPDKLALELWKASGGENWAKVKEIKFTFRVEEGEKVLASAQHDWNVAAGTDHVVWKDKDVTVNVLSPAPDENSKAAYARWVNDSYWLLAPLKIRDAGVVRKEEGKKEADGQWFETLRMSFQGVGLTPTDSYLLYIDPQTKLLRAWDYMPKAETMMHGTWEKYQTVGGLNLATEHNFGGKMIRFTGLEVIAEK